MVAKMKEEELLPRPDQLPLRAYDPRIEPIEQAIERLKSEADTPDNQRHLKRLRAQLTVLYGEVRARRSREMIALFQSREREESERKTARARQTQLLSWERRQAQKKEATDGSE